MQWMNEGHLETTRGRSLICISQQATGLEKLSRLSTEQVAEPDLNPQPCSELRLCSDFRVTDLERSSSLKSRERLFWVPSPRSASCCAPQSGAFVYALWREEGAQGPRPGVSSGSDINLLTGPDSGGPKASFTK